MNNTGPAASRLRKARTLPLKFVVDDDLPLSTEDKRSGIESDPNRPDDPEYIVRLVGQVIKVSLETVRIVKGLPERYAE